MRLLALLEEYWKVNKLTREQRLELFNYLEELHIALGRVEDKKVRKLILEQVELIHELLKSN